MKRVLLLVVAALTLALVVPVAASARSSHHRSHHKTHKTHKTRHAKARFVRVGSLMPTTTTTPGATSPDASSDGPAATIASFTGGVLTLTLDDGTSLSGNVTPDTEIECEAAATTPTATTADDHGDGGGSGDDNGGDRNRGGDHSQGDDGDDDSTGDQSTTCDATALVAGTVVREAELRIGSKGAIFKHVHLVK